MALCERDSVRYDCACVYERAKDNLNTDNMKIVILILNRRDAEVERELEKFGFVKKAALIAWGTRLLYQVDKQCKTG